MFCEISENEQNAKFELNERNYLKMTKLELNEQNFLKRRLGEKLR